MATSSKLSYNLLSNDPAKIAETSQFAMRHLLIFFLIFMVLSPTLKAEDTSASLYEVADVAVDVTAKNGVQARDMAIVVAQHQAFTELLHRLEAGKSLEKSMTDDEIASLVQSFEVQNERASSVRYMGIFTIRFKPSAVRNLLSTTHVDFIETRSRPFVVLPVYQGNTTTPPVLWESNTPWRAAWQASPPDNGVVPILVPLGGIDDVTLISALDAVGGKSSSVKAIMDKYQAEGAIVVTLRTPQDTMASGLHIDMQRFDNDGTANTVVPLTIDAEVTNTTVDMYLAEAVTRVRDELDKEWRQEIKSSPPHETTASDQPASGTEEALTPAAPPKSSLSSSHLPVIITLTSLSEWTLIKDKLSHIPSVVTTNIITLQRGVTNIDLEFRGSIADLQQAMFLQGLTLTLNTTTNAWVLIPLAPSQLH